MQGPLNIIRIDFDGCLGSIAGTSSRQFGVDWLHSARSGPQAEPDPRVQRLCDAIISTVSAGRLVLIVPEVGPIQGYEQLAERLAENGVQLNAVVSQLAVSSTPASGDQVDPEIVATGPRELGLLTRESPGSPQAVTPLVIDLAARMREQRTAVRDAFSKLVNMLATDYRVPDAELHAWIYRYFGSSSASQSTTLKWEVNGRLHTIDRKHLQPKFDEIAQALAAELAAQLPAFPDKSTTLRVDQALVRRFNLIPALQSVGITASVAPDRTADLAAWAERKASDGQLFVAKQSLQDTQAIPIRNKPAGAVLLKPSIDRGFTATTWSAWLSVLALVVGVAVGAMGYRMVAPLSGPSPQPTNDQSSRVSELEGQVAGKQAELALKESELTSQKASHEVELTNRDKSFSELKKGLEGQVSKLEDELKKLSAAGAAGAVGAVGGRAITNTIRMKLVRIEAGKFVMGSPASEAERSDDETQHEVKLTKAFYLGETEVTQGQWKAMMGTDPSRFKGDDLPVESVSWDDAVAFCAALSRKEGKSYRLPTEAEWEYACRAGTTTPFHTGATISPNLANYDGNDVYGGGAKGEYRQKTTPVRTFVGNAWGLYDMHGNVWEWCSDRYGAYPGNAVDDPTGPLQGERRVLRGGSWYYYPRFCRSAYRCWFAPDYRNNSVGFRVALDSP